WKKQLVTQTKGHNWAIRKPMHKETVSGKVLLKREKGIVSFNLGIENWKMIADKSIKSKVKGAFNLFDNDVKKVKIHFKKNPIKIDDKEVRKVTVYENIKATATRKILDTSFNEKTIKKITDTGIQLILKNHLKQDIYANQLDEKGKLIEPAVLAFSSEGIEDMNKNIVALNNGQKHQPIKKVRIYEVGSKFSISEDENSPKNKKYVEAAQGTNLFFAIYIDEEENRKYETIPLNEVIEHQKQVAHLTKNERTEIPVKKFVFERGKEILVQFLFSLSPNDLVYVPTDNEVENPKHVDFTNLSKEQVERIYSVNDFSDGTCNFTPNCFANGIRDNEVDMKWNVKKKKYTGHNSKTTSLNGIQIKEVCWKLKVDRLGNVARAK
ncbi:MAG: CRISPR-associated protein Csn1, partial [Flavobacteriales bacterium]|nr:CRISPR-associated protein Csn1 [Flavobacteriales bacterium]